MQYMRLLLIGTELCVHINFPLVSFQLHDVILLVLAFHNFCKSRCAIIQESPLESASPRVYAIKPSNQCIDFSSQSKNVRRQRNLPPVLPRQYLSYINPRTINFDILLLSLLETPFIPPPLLTPRIKPKHPAPCPPPRRVVYSPFLPSSFLSASASSSISPVTPSPLPPQALLAVV